MSFKTEIQNILPDSNYTCFVIPSLFSKQECEQLLNPNIKNSFQKAISNYPTYYRNNDRFVVDDKDLANQLFKKVKPYLPEIINIDSSINAETGIWHLKELNSRIRFCRYSVNQYFHRHLDGIYYQNETTQSKLTFMVYLNSATEFKGGRTLFFKTKDTGEIWAEYTPKQGDLIIFDHNVWHEGEALSDGEKFVLRSDILYSKELDVIAEEPFLGHLGYIWSLLKLNNDTILSGGRDKKINVWTTSGKLKQALIKHENSILCIEKISDDTFISGSRDQQIIVWKDYKMLNSIKIHSAIVLSLCRLTDNVFASSSGDNTIKISSLDGTVLKTLEGHTNWVWKVIKLDDNIIASSSEDNTLKIWSYETGTAINTIYTDNPVISIVFNNKTRQLISGDLNGQITIGNLSGDYQKHEKIRVFKAHQGIIRTIKLIDEKHFATGGEDNKVKVWNLEWQLITELEHQNFVQSIEVLDSNTILSASYDGTIKSWTI